MGVSLAGFDSLAVVEWDRWACDSIRENQQRGFPLVRNWPLWEGDVREFDWSTIPQDIDLLAGGPPCQPFSLGGKHRAHGDRRDMFPPTIDLVRRLRPKAFLIENVKGLTRASFQPYFQYLLRQLAQPERVRHPDESWDEHFQRLGNSQASREWTYQVTPTLVNAADYGVPQKRERVFIVGFRRDLEVQWTFPRPTHSQDALLHAQWISGTYWQRHGVARPPNPPAKTAPKIRKLASSWFPPQTLPWRTVRDALVEVPEPGETAHDFFYNHRLQPGARAYPGHTGSPIDLPAKTLKAGDHGVPGGENMLVRPDGSVRYFSVREAARLQTFPDGYVFHGAWSETMRQLGNAVPVRLAQVVASSIAVSLAEAEMKRLVQPLGMREAA